MYIFVSIFVALALPVQYIIGVVIHLSWNYLGLGLWRHCLVNVT